MTNPLKLTAAMCAVRASSWDTPRMCKDGHKKTHLSMPQLWGRLAVP